MSEKEFWAFLKEAWRRGRAAQVSGVKDSNDNQLHQAGNFLGGHALLPQGYDTIPKSRIIQIGKLLLSKNASIPAQEAMLVLLAHHPSKEALTALEAYTIEPEKELEFFAQCALDECRMWNE